ncbi:methylated-DNA--[protein]-cysteine S-methyltransferase [Paenibacillus sp. GCM10027626]|uniref:methylated-DNA--[protein]-cysteine S-methyltransferase n=1 Tax=Paenibacillus sp. GCM10027626 TaxID=3273411 RepID=UPI0036351907
MRTQLTWSKLLINEEEWLVLATERGLCRIIFPHEGLQDFQAWLGLVAPDSPLQEDDSALIQTGIAGLLQRYFAGEPVSFKDVPLDLIGTPFQQQVWTALADVPYGETRTYGDIAAAIDSPRAVRAVGAANGANPLPIILPCHRIVGANRKLTGFRGGLVMKKRLLELEGITDVADGGHARFQF